MRTRRYASENAKPYGAQSRDERIDYFIPTRIVFGAGRLKELATLSLPGKKALKVRRQAHGKLGVSSA